MGTPIATPLDDIDLQILALVQEDGRMPNTEIARRVGLVPSAIFQRLQKLAKAGVLRGFEARIDPSALGLGLMAFVLVKADEPVGSLESASEFARLPEVQELHYVAGDDCYLLKVRVSDAGALGRFLRDKVGVIEAVQATRTTVVLETIKETGRLPLPHDGG